jgi:hypothetical protein
MLALTCALVLPVLALLLAAVVLEQGATDDEHTVLIVVPKGTAYLQATGADSPMMPQLMTLRVGELDTIVIRNDDDFPVRVGPIRLAKGQQYRQRFRAAGEIQLVCATMYHKEQVTVRVLPLREGLMPWLRNKVR